MGVSWGASDGRHLGAQGAAAPGLAQEAQRSDGRRIHSEAGPGTNEQTSMDRTVSSHQRTGREWTVASSLYYRYLPVMRDEGPSGVWSPRTAVRARKVSPARHHGLYRVQPLSFPPNSVSQSPNSALGEWMAPPVLPAPAPRDPSHFFISEPSASPCWRAAFSPVAGPTPSCRGGAGGIAACLLRAPRSINPIPIQPRPVFLNGWRLSLRLREEQPTLFWAVTARLLPGKP